MITSTENLLNHQIKYEAQASKQDLVRASWADAKGYGEVADIVRNFL